MKDTLKLLLKWPRMISDVRKKTKIVSGDIFQGCPQFCTRTDIRTAGSTRMLELLFAKLSRSDGKSPANSQSI